MIKYIIKRLIYTIPILVGVNLLTFTLFFVVNSPEEVARLHLGNKRVTQEQIRTKKCQGTKEKRNAPISPNVTDFV